jgi:hypothetical protein
MALVPIFHGAVTAEGKLQLDAAEALLRQGHLKTLAGRRVDVIVRVHRKRRSDAQNKWHWGIAVPLIAHALGYDKHEHEAVHYALVAKCFGTHFDPILKQEVPNVRSSMLKTTEFAELMEWEVRWAASEHGIVIPLPNEAEVAA